MMLSVILYLSGSWGLLLTPPPNPLPHRERGSRRPNGSLCSPSPYGGGGWGEGSVLSSHRFVGCEFVQETGHAIRLVDDPFNISKHLLRRLGTYLVVNQAE